MNPVIKNLAFCAVLGASGSALAAPVLFPNGDFETPGGADWGQSFGGNQVISYPASGGNSGGYASIVSNEPGGYAVLISNNDQPYPLASLGLVAGNTYTFTYDMIASVAGANKGGVKLESWSATAVISNSGDQRVTAASTGWATYSYTYTIAPTATHLKIVPLWTPNETVGFDNIKVNNTPIVPPPVVPVIPNGDFEIPGGASWAFFQGGGQTVSYPAAGGNPNGCAVIDSVGKGAYAVMVANNNASMSLASLGLTAGQTYTFQQDMKILAGTNIGGLKVEFVPTGSGDLYPVKIGDGTQWATYSFQITIPPTCTQIQVVPLWGPDSQVAYDNFKILLPPPPGAPQVTIATGNLVNWTAPSAVNTYQVQGSQDGSNWMSVGPLFAGNSVTSLFDPSNSAFYQVLETTPPTLGNGVLNPGFETSNVTSTPADDWNTLNQLNGGSVTVAGTYSTFTPNGGSKMLIMEVQTPSVSPAPAIAEVRSSPITITGGTNYNFSFHAANVVKTGGSNPQFSYFFFNSSSQVINPPVFTSYASVGSAWTLVQHNFTAPAGATSMTVGFFMPTGAEANVNWVSLVDDVSLPTPSIPGDTTALETPPTVTPSAEISWPTATGRTYQASSSTNLVNWADFGGSINGNGQVWSIIDTLTPPSKFYRILQTAP